MNRRSLAMHMVLFVTLYSLTSLSQNKTQIVSLKNLVEINLPVGATKIVDGTAKRSLTERSIDPPKGEFYKIGNSFIQFNGAGGTAPENYLKDLQKGIENLTKTYSDREYVSEIRSFNDFNVLIIHSTDKNISTYSFYCLSNDRTKALNGKFEYNASDSTEMSKTLYKMLRSIHFK